MGSTYASENGSEDGAMSPRLTNGPSSICSFISLTRSIQTLRHLVRLFLPVLQSECHHVERPDSITHHGSARLIPAIASVHGMVCFHANSAGSSRDLGDTLALDPDPTPILYFRRRLERGDSHPHTSPHRCDSLPRTISRGAVALSLDFQQSTVQPKPTMLLVRGNTAIARLAVALVLFGAAGTEAARNNKFCPEDPFVGLLLAVHTTVKRANDICLATPARPTE